MATELGIGHSALKHIEAGRETPSPEALGGLQTLCSKNQQLGLAGLQTFISMLSMPD